jgi:hypothetical protein
MMGFFKKRYFFQLTQERIMAIEASAGISRVIFNETIDKIEDFPRRTGNGILIINRDSLLNQVIPIPSRGKVDVKNVVYHEAESLSNLPPSRLAIGWRSIGSFQENGILKELFLISTYPKDEIVSILDGLKKKGIRIEKVAGWLDLVIEKGRGIGKKGGMGIILFESRAVHFIFFKDGLYGFHRTFEIGEEGLTEELTLELKRSIYYAKQRFKSIVEEINIIIPPPWLDDMKISEIRGSLNIPINLISYPVEEGEIYQFPLLGLLLYESGIHSSLANILPPEAMREKHLRQISNAFVVMELCLICLFILLTYNNKTILNEDKSLYQKKLSHLRAIEEKINSYQEEFNRLDVLKKQAEEVRNLMKRRPFINLYLNALPYILPPQIHLESMRWIGEMGEEKEVASPPRGAKPERKGSNILTLSGRIDSEKSDERYMAFYQFIKNLKNIPSIEIGRLDSERILKDGAFEVSIHLVNEERGK